MKKFILYIAIMFIMITCLFSSGCISNDENITNVQTTNPLSAVTNQPKYSIEEIEKMVDENSANHFIVVGEHFSTYTLNRYEMFCSIKSDGHIYGYSVEGDFANYELKTDMLILSQEKSLYIVKDENLADRFVSIRVKGEEQENSFATILYTKQETFDYICSLLYK